ncbi:hypothetical protein PF010_g16540 [Phytophthora fragariae]|uniref:Uncharacterized protein n=1 Tax=Phytophthora fragariae TaxID=53985 RepID=A0A6G0KRK6_9STRA|nr:hypothetical protein PF010_g16540 [Phytophthora fragariae]KAE9210404.1 hypothetical protein PF004_g16195 [Phytophthora fragariae]
MADDDIAAAEIARQIAALRPRVEGSKGVMAYLDKPPSDKRADVNKTFLASTIRSVDSHNRRQEEDKCWTLRRMERELDEPRDSRRSRRRSRSRSRSREGRRSIDRKRRRSPSRSHSRSPSRRRNRNERSSSVRGRSRDRGAVGGGKKEDEDERGYWARKKAEKTRELWEKLHSEGTVSLENAPDFSAEDSSDDDDVKPLPKRREKKRNKDKKLKKHSRKSAKNLRRRSRS